MPRITLTTDHATGPQVIFEEQIESVHLSTGHAAAQLVERLAWALIDAEAGGARTARGPAPAHTRVDEHNRVIAARSYMTVRGG